MTTIVGAPVIFLFPGTELPPKAKDVLRANFQENGMAGVAVPIFMGIEPAERFQIQAGDRGKGLLIHRLDGLDDLEKWLADLKNDGVTHVDFNATVRRPNPTPIAEVIDGLRNRPR